MTAIELLGILVSFPSVVGRSNAPIVEEIRQYLLSFGAKVSIVDGPEGDRANLFATIGPNEQSGYILSGHMDVVPAGEQDWVSDPFSLRQEHGRLYGRGTTDMKGFLAASLAAVPIMAKMPLRRPIHLAFSYDEEAGCRGVPHLIGQLPELCAQPLGAIIGEPSHLQAILAHKGKAAARITVKGQSAHSSRPDLGFNAIHAISDILQAAVAEASRLTSGPLDAVFEPSYSSLQVGTIKGGCALNIIPDLCEIEVEARAIAGVNPTDLLLPLKARLDALAEKGVDAEWSELSAYPALSLAREEPLVKLLEELTGREALAAVSYGTEAGLYQAAGIDAIICGPGDINRAHKPNEYIREDELAACQSMIEALATSCCA